MAEEQVQSALSDRIKWAVVSTLFIAGVAANYYFSAIATPLRLIGWLLMVCVLGLIAVQTIKGKQVWDFGKQAQVELRKVNWPTRQETVKVTMVVVLMVFIVALFVWMMDSCLLWVMELLTGRRG